MVIVCLISAGLFMFTFQSTQFRWQGFLLALSASFLGGLRCEHDLRIDLKIDLTCNAHNASLNAFCVLQQGHLHN